MSKTLFPDKANGRPYRIAARGDCTSRRSLALNPDAFSRKPEFVQCGKSPFVLFNDAVKGKSITVEALREISDLSTMTPMLRDYYIGQADRSILDLPEVDLVLLDSYADMNFELWRNVAGEKFWIHPKHLVDPAGFYATHTKLGRRTLQQSVEDAVELIETLRKRSPGVPVLFLNQQTDYYPKLDDRMEEYYRLGELVAARLPDVYYGGVEPKGALELADVGSCGPGLTLHFQGSTYRRMIERAMGAGLARVLYSRVQQASVAEPKALDAFEEVVSETGAHPRVQLSMRTNSATCGSRCAPTWEMVKKAYARYFTFNGESAQLGQPPVFTPMLIPFSEIKDFDSWEAHIKTFGKGARIRQKKKAVAAGYYVKPFRWHMYIPDIYAANTSMPARSGGTIRSNLMKTVEEMGGAPTRSLPVVMPACKYHWQMTFGVFLAKPGHRQGEVQVDEELVGYITPRRIGDVAIYTQILGHGDHLPNGVLTLLHHEVMRWLLENSLDDGYADGLKYVMYGGLENGGRSDLLRFKRQAGFEPHYVDVAP